MEEDSTGNLESRLTLLIALLAYRRDLIDEDNFRSAISRLRSKSNGLLEDTLAVQNDPREERELLQELFDEYEKAMGVSPGAVSAMSSVEEALANLQQILPNSSRLSEGINSIEQTVAETRNGSSDKPVVIKQNPLRYQILHLHAKGGLGEVYIANDLELNRQVALKRIKQRFARHAENRRRFVQEAELTGRLEHPNIVPVYGLGQYATGDPYYAMRFIEGESFQKQISSYHEQHDTSKRSHFISRDFHALLRRFIDACNAIHFAHEHGVLHRDIKPSNIMLGHYGETLVVDWGLAKVIGTAPSSIGVGRLSGQKLSGDGTSTGVGGTIGTPMYMSPEQARGELEQLGPRSDVYSLGATLFTIISNSYPVDSDDRSTIIDCVAKGKIRQLKDVCPVTPAALCSICHKAMALTPEERYRTPRDLADDLELWMADEAVLAHKNQETWPERAGRLLRRYRNWTFSILAAALSIVLISLVATWLINRARVREYQAKERADEYRVEALSRYRQSREVVDAFLVDANESLAYFPATFSIRERMLAMAEKHYQELSKAENQDPELEIERGRAQVRLGDVLQMQARFSEARDYYKRAIETFEQDASLKQPDNQRMANRLRVEAAYTHARMGLAWDFEDQIDKANLAFGQAIAIREQFKSRVSLWVPQTLVVLVSLVNRPIRSL